MLWSRNQQKDMCVSVVDGIGGGSVVPVYRFGTVSSGVTFAKKVLVLFLFLRC